MEIPNDIFEQMLPIYHSHPVTAVKPSTEDLRLSFTTDIGYVTILLEEAATLPTRALVVEDDEPSCLPLDTAKGS